MSFELPFVEQLLLRQTPAPSFCCSCLKGTLHIMAAVIPKPAHPPVTAAQHTTDVATCLQGPSPPRCRTILRAFRRLFISKNRGHRRSSWERPEERGGGTASPEVPLQDVDECECVMPCSVVQEEAPPPPSVVVEEEEKSVSKDQAPPAEVLLLRPRNALLVFRSDVVNPPATLLLSCCRHDNDHLYKQATERVVFFHVRGLPSAHVYLQLQPGQDLWKVPRLLLQDAAQLCTANSVQANKVNNVTVEYTLGSNLRQKGRAPGTVRYVNALNTYRMPVVRRDEGIIRRLNLTKRKAFSARVERALEKKRQRAEAKKQQQQSEHEQQQKDQIQDHLREAADGPEDQQALPSDIEAKRFPVPRQEERQSLRWWKRRCNEDGEDSEAPEPEEAAGQPQAETNETTTRCFTVDGKQRRLLQRCCVLVEQRHNVHVVPPRGDAAGCGTVTGAPEDVANALAELRKHLGTDKQPTAPETDKARDTKKDGKAGKNKTAEDKEHATSKGTGRKAIVTKGNKGQGASKHLHK